MNLTQEQQELLQQIVDVYDSGCREPFIFSESHSGRFLHGADESLPAYRFRVGEPILSNWSGRTWNTGGNRAHSNGKPTQDGPELGRKLRGTHAVAGPPPMPGSMSSSELVSAPPVHEVGVPIIRRETPLRTTRRANEAVRLLSARGNQGTPSVAGASSSSATATRRIGWKWRSTSKRSCI